MYLSCIYHGYTSASMDILQQKESAPKLPRVLHQTTDRSARIPVNDGKEVW